MKIAYVVSDLSFPPREGLHQQTIELLRALAAQGADIDLYGFIKDPTALDRAAFASYAGLDFALPPIYRPAPTLVRGVVNRFPRLPWAPESKLIRALRDGNYDAIHLEGAASIGLIRRSFARKTIVSVIDPQSWRYWRLYRQSSNVRHAVGNLVTSAIAFLFERSIVRLAATCHMVSPSDAEYFRRAHPKAGVIVIPILIPPNIMSFAESPHATIEDRPKRILVYTDLRSSGGHAALADFGTALRENGFDNDLTASEFRVLGRAAASSELTKLMPPSTKFLEWVDDYVSELLAADVVVLPDVVGTGIKNRAVQSIALGCLVLGTDVAFEGIEVGPTVARLRFASNSKLVMGLKKTLENDHQESESLRGNSQAEIRTVFSPEAIVQKWLNVYRTLAETAD